MISCLIPSLDRAAQLDCFLSSLEKFFPQCKDVKILYKYSNREYLKGYDIVKELHPNIDLWTEIDFYRDWKDILENYCNDYVMLATDDCVLFEKIDLDINKIFTNNVHCISLRLGCNTIVQNYITGFTQEPLDKYGYIMDYKTVKWKYKLFHKYSNYEYNWSLDLTIYKKESLLRAIEGIKFDCPRSLEYNLVIKPGLINTLPTYMVAPIYSCGFVNTINCVQQNGQLPAGTKFSYTPKELNDRFLSGERISLKSFEGLTNNIISSHEEVPLIFEKI